MLTSVELREGIRPIVRTTHLLVAPFFCCGADGDFARLGFRGDSRAQTGTDPTWPADRTAAACNPNRLAAHTTPESVGATGDANRLALPRQTRALIPCAFVVGGIFWRRWSDFGKALIDGPLRLLTGERSLAAVRFQTLFRFLSFTREAGHVS